ncbi:unnamed protein product [marine sediment metagenome]|uniref:Uncharacterized protein n=1 Tax=marine sediment metagenome TaxID=412755 RepID=X1CTS6_9ZZZZ
MTAQFATFCTAHPNIQVLCELYDAGDCPECKLDAVRSELDAIEYGDEYVREIVAKLKAAIGDGE